MSSSGFERRERLLRFAIEQGDSSMFAMLQNGEKFAETIEETMEKIIYQLAKDKANILQAYQAEVALNSRKEKK